MNFLYFLLFFEDFLPFLDPDPDRLTHFKPDSDPKHWLSFVLKRHFSTEIEIGKKVILGEYSIV
jgi:hypothetical protein